MKLARQLALGVSFIACIMHASCKSEPTPYDDVDVAGPTTNPDGVPYPTDRVGQAPHTSTRVGSRLANVSFMGYPDADRSKGLQTLSMARFYDPSGARIKVIQLAVVASWCSICASQTDASQSVRDALAARGVVFVEAMVNGQRQSEGPSLGEIDDWIDTHHSTMTLVIDARGRRLGQLGAVAVPWNALIDARSMEILDSGVGAPRDIVAYVAQGLRFVEENPPSF